MPFVDGKERLNQQARLFSPRHSFLSLRRLHCNQVAGNDRRDGPLTFERAQQLFATGKTHTYSSTNVDEYVGYRSFDGKSRMSSQQEQRSLDSDTETQVGFYLA